ncbi:replication termination factor 2-like [Amphibalanus amphitrite]|uniref:replication termination factor 2-like n=1 Tax=Amphibalanus amphitrite TaxID=1232801 RepID=UPI001C90EE6D|nr:replication termination factor 2-like [Amphibalanus amphitrite]
MGCDGGTIPRRDELVRTKKQGEQKDKDSVRKFKWQNCSISQSKLEKPIVACELGNLYSKSSVLEVLLDKDSKPILAEHIKGLKDVKVLNLSENTAASVGPSKGDSMVDEEASEYICNVTGLEMNGKYKFVFLWSCGCVFSERAIKMVKSETCHKCNTPFTDHDVIVLNPDDDELTQMRARMEERRAKAKALKKSKRSKEAEESASMSTEPAAKKKKSGTEKQAKTLAGPSINLPNNGKLVDPAFAKASASYSVAKDSQKTEVYKSLFTSHESAKTRQTAHWVTYNPLFN